MSQLADYLYQVETSTRLHARATRKTGKQDTCPICGELVDLIEHELPMLTSYGTGYHWKQGPACLHRRECFKEVQLHADRDRPIGLDGIDLWDPDGQRESNLPVHAGLSDHEVAHRIAILRENGQSLDAIADLYGRDLVDRLLRKDDA